MQEELMVKDAAHQFAVEVSERARTKCSLGQDQPLMYKSSKAHTHSANINIVHMLSYHQQLTYA